MQHFFVDASQIREQEIMITGSDVNHMKQVLRMRIGEQVTVNNSAGQQFLCEIAGYEQQDGEEVALLHVLSVSETDTELPSKIYLFQGLPKQDKMELIIQKAVELGAYSVIPVATKRAVVKLDEKKARKKVERWQQIAESAAKQSGRGIVPQVGKVVSYKEALKEAAELDVLLIPYELAEGMKETKEIIESIKPGQSIGIFIGPEGGFEIAEVEAAVAVGAKAITLGKRILRTETAGMTTLSVLMFALEGA